MKVTLELDNLENIVQTTLEKNLGNVVKEQIADIVKKTADNLIKDTINTQVSKNFQRFVDDYIATKRLKLADLIGIMNQNRNTQ
jgi:hypothetical protein